MIKAFIISILLVIGSIGCTSTPDTVGFNKEVIHNFFANDWDIHLSSEDQAMVGMLLSGHTVSSTFMLDNTGNEGFLVLKVAIDVDHAEVGIKIAYTGHIDDYGRLWLIPKLAEFGDNVRLLIEGDTVRIIEDSHTEGIGLQELHRFKIKVIK